MSKDRIVIFTSLNARILRIDEEMIAQYKDYANAIINPDLSGVKSIPPHFWKKEGNRIVAMNKYEMDYRSKQLGKSVARKVIEIKDERVIMPNMFWIAWMKFNDILSRIFTQRVW